MDLFNIETGFFLVDGGALFGVVPKLAWNAEYECDENNFCKLVMRSLLIKSKNKLILVDAGVGIKHQDVMSEFGFSGLKPIEEELKKNPEWTISVEKLKDIKKAIAERREKTIDVVRQRIAPKKVSK